MDFKKKKRSYCSSQLIWDSEGMNFSMYQAPCEYIAHGSHLPISLFVDVLAKVSRVNLCISSVLWKTRTSQDMVKVIVTKPLRQGGWGLPLTEGTLLHCWMRHWRKLTSTETRGDCIRLRLGEHRGSQSHLVEQIQVMETCHLFIPWRRTCWVPPALCSLLKIPVSAVHWVLHWVWNLGCYVSRIWCWWGSSWRIVDTGNCKCWSTKKNSLSTGATQWVRQHYWRAWVGCFWSEPFRPEHSVQFWSPYWTDATKLERQHKRFTWWQDSWDWVIGKRYFLEIREREAIV